MKNVHLICNAHLDPVWLWKWEEGCTEAISTYRTASDFIGEFPGFKFNHNEAILYEWVKENEPELYENIKGQVKAGNWHIMGGWYLQPDCNMPAGESFIRNIMMGRKFFSEDFNVRPTTAINFDSFGHTKGLVQILTQSGYDSYVVCRPASNNFQFKEQDYLWKGLNNSEILVHRSDENYNSILGKVSSELDGFLERKKDEAVTLFLWGVGDHGGGPSRKDLQDLEEKFKNAGEEYHFIHSSPEEYFKELRTKRPNLPVVDRGLNPVAEGCYTSQIRVKQKHRELENAIYSCEKMFSSATIQYGKTYPKDRLDEAVRDLIVAEFHDALPGSGSQNVEEDTLRILDHGLEIMSQEKIKAFIALSAGLSKVVDGTSSVLVYNPHPYDLTDTFEFEVGLPKQNWDNSFMTPTVYLDGELVPTQSEMESSHFCIDWRKKVSIFATFKASSIHKLDVHFAPIPKRVTFESIANKKNFVFDNGKMQAVINTSTGLMDSYVVDGVELIKPNSFKLVARDDTYNSWGLRKHSSHFEYTMNLLTPHEGSAFSGLDDSVVPSVRVIEDGEVRTVIESLFGFNKSYAYQRYTMPKIGTDIEIETGVYWNEKDVYLKLEIDTAIENGEYFGQVPFGQDVLKSNGDEVVSQKWVAYKNSEDTLALINSGTYGSNFSEGKIGLTLLRSAGYSAADGNFEKTLHEVRHTVRMEQGERIFKFRMSGGKTVELMKDIDKKALFFNENPYALAFCPSGKGEKQKPLVLFDNAAVILSAFKLAHDDSGYIMRLYESTGTAQTVAIDMPALGMTTNVSVNPFEIKTFHINPTSKIITETTIIENL